MSFGYGGPFRPGYPDSTDYEDSETSQSNEAKRVNVTKCIGKGIWFIGVFLIVFAMFPTFFTFIPGVYNDTETAGWLFGGLIMTIIGFLVDIVG